MPDLTTIGQGLVVDLPVTQSAREIYDTIMGNIEPELTSSQIPLLKEKYKDETPEQKKKRSKRYTEAKKEFDVRLAAFHSALKEKSHAYHKDAMRTAEADARSNEEAELSSIESSIATL